MLANVHMNTAEVAAASRGLPAAKPASSDIEAWFRRGPRFRLRATYPRMQVLRAVEHAGAQGIHCQDLHQNLQRDGVCLPLSTIYRVAQELARTGLLACERGLDGKTLYRLRA